MIDRRAFLGRSSLLVGAAALLTVPQMAAPIAVAVVRPRRQRTIPPKCSGDVLTAQSWNELVDRVNTLSDALR